MLSPPITEVHVISGIERLRFTSLLAHWAVNFTGKGSIPARL